MIAGWLIVGIVIVGIVVLFKVTGKVGKGVGIAIGVLLLFLIGTFGFFVTRPGVSDIDGFGDFIDTSQLYFVWVGSIFKNAQSVTGYATAIDWDESLEDAARDSELGDDTGEESEDKGGLLQYLS